MTVILKTESLPSLPTDRQAQAYAGGFLSHIKKARPSFPEGEPKIVFHNIL